MSTATQSNKGQTIAIGGFEITFTKTFLIGSIVAVIFTALIITIIVLATRKAPTNIVTTCNSASCYSYGARLVESLDTSVKPCDNFYQYACGKWIRNAVVDDTEEWETGFQQQQVLVNKRMRTILESNSKTSYVIKAQNAYLPCMEQNETKDYEILSTTIKEFSDGFPLVEREQWKKRNKIESLNELLLFLASLRQRYSSLGALFTVAVMNDFYNNNNSMLFLGQPGLPTFNTKEAILNRCKMISQNCESNQADQEIEKVLKILNQTQTILEPSPLQLSDGYTKMSILEFSLLTTNFNWLGFFNKLFENVHTFTLNDVIAIPNLPYFKKLNSIIQENGIDFISVINLEILHLIDPIFEKNTAISGLQELYFPSSNTFPLYNAPTPRYKPRWLQCVQTVSSWLKLGLAVEYATQYYDIDKQVKSVQELAQSLIDIFHERIETLDWLDESSKKIAKLKLDYMKGNYVFPDWAKNPENLKKYYQDLNIGSSHVTNYLNTLNFFNKKNLNSLKPTKDDLVDWILSSLVPNAYYSSLTNSFFITTAILQFPIFDADLLYAMKYGVMGSALGHEITHGFDLTGTKFNQFGNLENWLTPKVEQVFLNKSQCFIDQYSKFFLSSAELPTLTSPSQVNGKKTVSENIADNGGIQQAYWAYQKWSQLNGPEKMPDLLRDFTPQQIFFISYSNYWCIKYSYSKNLEGLVVNGVHSPPKFRVLGSLANFEEFNKAFNCPTIDKPKCKIW